LLDMVASSRRYASVPPRAWPQPRKALLLVKVLLTDTIVQIYRGTFGLIPAALSRPAQSGPGAIGPTRGRMQRPHQWWLTLWLSIAGQACTLPSAAA